MFKTELNNLLETFKIGNYKDAEKIALNLSTKYPSDNFLFKMLGAIFAQTGKLDKAVKANKKAIKLDPNDFQAKNNLGAILIKLEKFNEAEKVLRQSIIIKPSFAEAYNNLGKALMELEKFDDAEIYLKQSITLKNDYAEAHYNLGNVYKELRKYDNAEIYLKKAVYLKPDFLEAYSNLSLIYIELGRLNEAENNSKQAAKIKPNNAIVHFNLANILQELGKLDDSKKSYQQAISLNPNHSESYLNLCELLEKTNKINESLIVIKNAKKNNIEKKIDLSFYEALIQFRLENFDIAGSIIMKIDDTQLSNKRKLSFLKLKADWYHYKRDFSNAFKTYNNMNYNIKKSSDYKFNAAENYFKNQKEMINQIKNIHNVYSKQNIIIPDWAQPTFIIGFPRSGTTLLDTILRSHSKINVIEEQPMVAKMENEISQFSKISFVEEINFILAKKLSYQYFKELKKHCVLEKDKIIIDKYPLNILKIPLINRIFPNSKFILAIRHPLDCVMSCWMQNFYLNAPMANMVDLNRIVDLYIIIMDTFNYLEKRYSLNFLKVRYEDIVNNFEKEVSNILEFLNLKWEDNLTNYQKTALLRGKINTPSYSQVVKPLYNSASYRWKSYSNYLETFKLRLSPWIKEFGY